MTYVGDRKEKLKDLADKLKSIFKTYINKNIMKNNREKTSNLFYNLAKNGIGLVCFILLFANAINTQAQAQNLSYWISGNSGLYTGGEELDDAIVIGTDINVGWKHNLWTIQMNYAPDYILKDNRDFELYEYSGLYGYQKHFSDGRFYVATGLSYYDLKRNNSSRTAPLIFSNVENTVEKSMEDYAKFGVPIKIGIITHLSKRIAIGSAYFANINSNKSYFGYQVSLQFGLFSY